ncbi:helix-turn-helix domain-containing protein [Marinomonas spartinae]|uniref:helix-turn-helix domain-containing protein n=1 Tax=Marinomonas spartinae TaxID=1792290 RepID=UPI0018F25098|nr:DNA-binding protein [Marinomonas spartinae]MBJ7554957.1 DNA-binding protein [Marinomonas spartinae]
MNIKPIKNDDDLTLAVLRMRSLRGAELGSPEGDEIEILATLVEAYEEKHHAIDAPDPIEAIKFRMDQMGLKDADLTPFVGQRSRVTEVLKKQRALNLRMIRNLHKGLNIPLDALVKDYPLERETM